MNESSQPHGYRSSVSLRLLERCPNTQMFFDFWRTVTRFYLQSTYSWNTTDLLLQAGDIEINPGPTRKKDRRANINGKRVWIPDPNSVKCVICKSTINSGPSLAAASVCDNENCTERCHQKCNGLTVCQARRAREQNRQVRWLCGKHGHGIAQVIVPAAAVFTRTAREPASGKACAVCGKTIQARFADSAYHCVEENCVNVCHLSKSCSGFVIPRGSNRDQTLATRQWRCTGHDSSQTREETQTPEQQSTAPPRMDELRARGMTFDEAKQARERCGKCHCVLRSNSQPIRCCQCSTGFHLKCSIGRHGSDGQATEFRCANCDKQAQNERAAAESADQPAEPLSHGQTISQPTGRASRPKLTIMQWNADGIRTKMFELRDRMLHSDIDICAVQETKLRKTDKTPIIEGYASIRADRKHLSGGGLLLFIRKDIVYEPLKATERVGQEVQTVRIKAGKNDWIDLVNVYLPNTDTQLTKFEPRLISSTPRSIIVGDLNAHSRLWDNEQPQDSRGQEIEDWLLDQDLHLLNDGSCTRHSRITARGSTPDLSLCGNKWTAKATWMTQEPIGDSDHLPISITIDHNIKYQQVIPRAASWKRNGVNWEAFSNEVELQIMKLSEESNLSARIARFTNILTNTAETHVGKTKPRRKAKPWMTPVVRAKIRTRNILRGTIGTNRQEWIEACRDANEAVRNAKENSWRELLEDAMTNTDETKMWQIIRGLNGTPDTNSPNEAMIHDGRLITDAKAKANVFVKHYARVSNLKMSKQDRNLNREFKQRVEAPSADDESCSSIQIGELTAAIKKMKRKGAAGQDGIPPTFLKALGPCALAELLHIFNLSFLRADCPRIWRVAIIIPLLKKGKPASDVASYRPVSLTSCIAKLMERVLADRLYYIAESRHLFSRFQAGFRKGRSCEDQILKVVQAIEDGFQRKPMQRSVLALLDFSKAFDTVWKEKLLLQMLEIGIPATLIRWIQAFLSDRRARVRLNNVLSTSRRFRQGLPQGSVLAPLLFLFYINSLAKLLPEDDVIAMFADDVSIVATARDKRVAEQSVQSSIDIVCNWSRQWKLQLNAAKSEACAFSTWTNDAKWKPSLTVSGVPIPHNDSPRLLGVLLDRSLTFNAHVNKLTSDLSSRIRMLQAVAHSQWGWHRHNLRAIFFAMIRSRLDYAAPAWQPWISATNMDRLERVQNRALRVITGQLQSTPLEALRAEANINSYATVSKRSTLRAMEKALRAAEDHPKRTALEKDIPQRLESRMSWRRNALELAGHLPVELQHRQPFNLFAISPWQLADTARHTININVPEISGRNDTAQRKLEMSLACIQEIAADYTIYTDGSATAGVRNGGAAAVVTIGNARQPNIIKVLKRRGKPFTSSYGEEVDAMHEALEWVTVNANSKKLSILICTDSQSLCTALQGNSSRIDHLRKQLSEIQSKVTVQWIPGHSDIPGNEAADQAAKDATTKQCDVPSLICFSSACSVIRSTINDGPIQHQRTAKIYKERCLRRDRAQITSRSDEVLLSRLRSGHHPAFRAYQQRLNDEIDPTCPACGTSNHTLEHWMIDCPALGAERQRVFGHPQGKLEWLATFPGVSVAFARKTLVNLDA